MALVSTDVDDKIKGMTGPKGGKAAGKKVGKKVAKFASAKGGKK